jgi:hypothetical protein
MARLSQRGKVRSEGYVRASRDGDGRLAAGRSTRGWGDEEQRRRALS